VLSIAMSSPLLGVDSLPPSLQALHLDLASGATGAAWWAGARLYAVCPHAHSAWRPRTRIHECMRACVRPPPSPPPPPPHTHTHHQATRCSSCPACARRWRALPRRCRSCSTSAWAWSSTHCSAAATLTCWTRSPASRSCAR
jgi:hypothetical protein